MAEIHKKTWRTSFEKVLAGDKTFEIRLADWKCEPGDILILDEVDDETKEYTGRSIRKIVGTVARLDEMPDYWPEEEVAKFGYQVISLKEEK